MLIRVCLIFFFVAGCLKLNAQKDSTSAKSFVFSVLLINYTSENIKDSLKRWEKLDLDPIYTITEKNGNQKIKSCMMGRYSSLEMAGKRCDYLRNNGFPNARVCAFKNGTLVKEDTSTQIKKENYPDQQKK